MFWEIFHVSESDKAKIYIYKVPFTLHPLVELFHISTNAKEEEKLNQSMPSKKSVKVSFATSGTQKSRGFFVFARV